MSRSIWKGPFVDGYLLKKAEKARGSGSNAVIKMWSRRSTILPQFVVLTFGVHNGHKHIPVLVTEDMAAPPKGKVFELWLQDENGRMSPAGLMSTAGDNKLLLKGDAAEATGVGITVEPEGGSDQPTTEPIALIDMSKGEA